MNWTVLSNIFQGLAHIPLSLGSISIWRKLQLKWRGPKPPLALRLKFLRDTKLKLSSKATIRQLTYEALCYIQAQTNYFNRQEIKENEEQDRALLEKSWLNFYPHEVTLIRIENLQNEEFCSTLHHGGPYRGASLKGIRKQISELVFAARKKGLSVTEVQIVHTHPSVEAIIEEETTKASSFIFNGLSSSDQDLGRMVAPFVPYPVRVKAITPVANYSMLF